MPARRVPGLVPLLGLLAIGALWGLTTPLVKIAVSTGYRPLGLLFWFSFIAAVLLGAVVLLTGRRLALDRPHLHLYAVVALFGMVLPQIASYTAAPHLPSGVLSLVISLVPLFALPVALMIGMERFRASRATGLLLGAGAMALLTGSDTALPDRAAAAFVLIAALGPLCYALEGIYVDGWGTRAADPVQTLFGASLMALALSIPAALISGQGISPFRVWGAPEAAILLAGLLAVIAYMGYVALLRRTGAVFAGQVSYIVTGSGVVWAMLILGERYGPWFWLALALLFCGLFLVQPRPKLPPVPAPQAG